MTRTAVRTSDLAAGRRVSVACLLLLPGLAVGCQEMPAAEDTETGTGTGERVWVGRVVDGDTVELADGRGVRLLGIDTPERGECGYAEASAHLADLVEGRQVKLRRNPGDDDADRYGRLLRYVVVDGTDVGLAQLRGGYANARYDSRDGYGPHVHERAYIAADEATDHICPPLD